jgi:hypothetical protein
LISGLPRQKRGKRAAPACRIRRNDKGCQTKRNEDGSKPQQQDKLENTGQLQIKKPDK